MRVFITLKHAIYFQIRSVQRFPSQVYILENYDTKERLKARNDIEYYYINAIIWKYYNI